MWLDILNICCQNLAWRPTVAGLAFESIDQFSSDWLKRIFEEEEVLDVIRGMSKDKALALDGFSMSFFQARWDIVQEDIMKVFGEFYS